MEADIEGVLAKQYAFKVSFGSVVQISKKNAQRKSKKVHANQDIY